MIDILSQRSIDSNYFTVNTALPYVELIPPIGGLLQTAEEKSVLQKTDHVFLLSAGYVLPLGFEIFKTVVSVNGDEILGLPELAFYYALTTYYPPTPFDIPFQRIIIPFANYELNIGKYYTTPQDVNDKFCLFGKISPDHSVKISMLGVPEELNEQRFYCPIFVKILHTLELEALQPPPPGEDINVFTQFHINQIMRNEQSEPPQQP